jgi:hypothetical protein
VQVVTHPTLHLCKGVMNHNDSSTESEENLKAFFENEVVVDIDRIHRRVDGRLVPVQSCLLGCTAM